MFHRNMLDVQRLILVLIRHHLRLLVQRLLRRDRDAAEQLRRAARSLNHNTAEGLRARAGNRPVRLQRAENSGREAMFGLYDAWAWGYLEPEHIHEPVELLDRIIAMLVRLRGE